MEKLKIDLFNADNQMLELCFKVCQDADCKTEEDVKWQVQNCFTNLAEVENASGKATPAARAAVFRNRFEYFANETFNKLGLKHPISSDPVQIEDAPDPLMFLACTKLLLPNQNPAFIQDNIRNIHRVVSSLKFHLKQEDSNYQNMLYLYSPLGQTGKSLFASMIKHWAQTNGIYTASARVPQNQFVGEEFSRNGIVFFEDLLDGEVKDWAKMNNLIDCGEYIVEKKGKDRYSARAQAFLIATSNFVPRDDNNRRIQNSVIYMGSTPISQDKLGIVYQMKDGKINYQFYDIIVQKWLETCPAWDFDWDKWFPQVESDIHLMIKAVPPDYIWVLQSICKFLMLPSCPVDYKISASVSGLKYQLSRFKSDLEIAEGAEKFQNKGIFQVFQSLVKAGFISKPKPTKSVYGARFDMVPLVKEAPNILAFDSLDYGTDLPAEDYKTTSMIYSEIGKKLLDAGFKVLPDAQKILKI